MEENNRVTMYLPQGALSLIFWGLLMSFFDFRINGLDLIPDTIGVILVLRGLSRLKEVNRCFAAAISLYGILLPMSVFDDLSWPIFGSGFFAILVAFVFFVLDLVALYYLCSGIAGFAALSGLEDLSRTIMQRYTIYGVLVSLTYCLMFLLPSLAIAGMICGLVAYILVLSVIRTADNQLPQQ